MKRRWIILVGWLLGTVLHGEAQTNAHEGFVQKYCMDCHSGKDPDGDMDLSGTLIDWQSPETVSRWETVHHMLETQEMPPDDEPQPTAEERQAMLDWLGNELTEHGKIGGTVPRRLNREEYENTIRDLFHDPDFAVSNAFPADDSAHGFDNVGEGLVLSPPLLAQYLELATQIADDILPPDSGPAVAKPQEYAMEPDGFTEDTGAGAAFSKDRFRLASSLNMANSAAWPARFEAAQSGVYRLSITATPFQTDKMFYQKRQESLQLEVYARRSAEQVYDVFDKLRALASFEVDPEQALPQTFTCEVTLFKGEIFGLRWADGPAYSDGQVRAYSRTFLAERLTKNRRFYAAMLKLKGGRRGITQSEYYEEMNALIAGDDLDLKDSQLDALPQYWGGGLSDAPHNWIKAYVLEEMHRHGPALDVLSAEIEGPLSLVEDDESRARKARAALFLGDRPAEVADRDFVETVLRRFLSSAFRRPIDDDTLQEYVNLAMQGSERLEDGLHLAVRRALVSPQFLYRSLRPGVLDTSDLAARLSYFLTSSPPEESSSLEEVSAEVLERESLRLLQGERSVNFVRSFTGQWLGTRMLKDIMPDPRLLQFYDQDRRAMIAETELFFTEMLEENHPLVNFIDPDFSYRNANLNKIYGGDVQGSEMQRVALERGGKHGGVLGLASVMMATANGVDTQPILRGVWLLENVLGSPTPPPPADIPAIAPDTSGARSMREQLNAHRADVSCARCHNRIDPLGMALENFDPVGRWRDHYPVYTKPEDGAKRLKEEFYANKGPATRRGPAIDATGQLPDGTRLESVIDLKRYLVENMDLFTTCLTEKLLVFATGRPLSFGDRRVVEQIVHQLDPDQHGLRDLIVALVKSESFRTK